jgi:hypothetical protein
MQVAFCCQECRVHSCCVCAFFHRTRALQCQVKVVIVNSLTHSHTLTPQVDNYGCEISWKYASESARGCNYRAKTPQFWCEIIVALITERRRLNYFLPIAPRMGKFHTILSRTQERSCCFFFSWLIAISYGATKTLATYAAKRNWLLMASAEVSDFANCRANDWWESEVQSNSCILLVFCRVCCHRVEQISGNLDWSNLAQILLKF